MRRLVIFFSLFTAFVAAGKHLNANGPFGKRHSFRDETSPHGCNRPIGVAVSSVFSASRSVATLIVSATAYNSNDQINVTWTPILTACDDDFIGIYFAEIALNQGKYCYFFLLYPI